jgi:hypothetical protein
LVAEPALFDTCFVAEVDPAEGVVVGLLGEVVRREQEKSKLGYGPDL